MRKLFLTLCVVVLCSMSVNAQIDSCDSQFPGDFDNSGVIDITDLTLLVSFIRGNGEAPLTLSNADVNGDCVISPDDYDYLFAYISNTGPAPVDCTCLSPDTCSFQFPGDFDNSGAIDITDLTSLVSYLRGTGDAPLILANADVNGDCVVDFNDTDYLVAYISNSGPAPVDCTCLSPDTCSFQIIGDIDNSGSFDISDLVAFVNFYNGGDAPLILANADVNGDCIIDTNDIELMADVISGSGTFVDCTCLSPQVCINQMPGDFNSDGFFDISDILFFGEYLNGNGPAPDPLANADANGDCIINVGDSKLLNDFLFFGGPPPVDCTCENPEFMTICCWEERGNVNYDPVDAVDIGDLISLVEFMFKSGATPLCLDEADIDGSTGIDISDLVTLVSFMFTQGIPPASCQ